MKSLYLIMLFLLIAVTAGCHREQKKFRVDTAETVSSLRQNGYHEYSSKLNDVVFAELNNWENDVIPSKTLESISEISDQLQREQTTNGCYVIEWKTKQKLEPTNTITLEWNERQGVVIRIFTLSEKIKQVLPSHSYS